MSTILADTFTTSLAKLSNDEQKQAKLTAFDLQMNPDQPGLQFHRIDKSKDPNFWSVRVTRDVRLIVHKTQDSVMLVHVGHHDDAYKWAERRRIETHPTTGALQIVEVRERIEEEPAALAPVQAALDIDQPEMPPVPLFAALGRDDLLAAGIPLDWLEPVQAATEDAFFALAGHLPREASEALLEFAATGRLPVPPPPAANPLEHPDSQRRFRVLEDLEELRAALDAPFEQWTVFLHPSQRGVVQRRYGGPARVLGSAGTGKTVVALHRVVRLLREEPDARVLLTTFSDPLARTLRSKLNLLIGERPGLVDRVSIGSFLDIAAQLSALNTGHKPHVAVEDIIRSLIAKAAAAAGVTEFTAQFLYSEWTYVIDAWQIATLDAYADVPRMGRKNRLGVRQRERLWQVFSAVRTNLRERGLTTPAGIFADVTATYAAKGEKPFTHVIVDEAQDLGVAELRFLSAISPPSADALFFAGDIGQRIFQQPFSWLGLGVDVRGRSATLKVNYRTSHQIRRAADRLLPGKVRDVDGIEDDRAGTVSVFDGPEPEIFLAPDETAERERTAEFLRDATREGISPRDIGLFVRSNAQLPRARAIATAAGLSVRSLAETAPSESAVLVGTMHLAKGLEFRVVAIVACDDRVLPLEERVRDVADEFELDEVVATERQLLYVAATRARERLWISGVMPASEFLDDFATRPSGSPSERQSP